MIKKIFLVLLVLLAILLLAFFLGPRPSYEKVDNKPISISQDINTIEQWVADREASIDHLKEDNEAKIIWADSAKVKTDYSIVYLHGFSASHGEGFPSHINIADSIHANMFLSRLPGHGILDKDCMKGLTPGDMIESAKEAIAIGKLLGDKVIIMACSTGGTLGIYTAAGDPDIAGLVMLSPNIAVEHPASQLLTGPWGKQLARMMIGTYRTPPSQDAEFINFWTLTYHTDGIVAMQALLDQTMQDDVFDDISCPVYTGYYYKNEETKDHVISTDAIRNFQSELEVAPELIEFETFSRGDHVLGCIYKNEHWPEVQTEVLDFIQTKILAKAGLKNR